jgi:cytochrome c oxidase subunit II
VVQSLIGLLSGHRQQAVRESARPETVLIIPTCVLLSGCDGWQSVLHARGEEAELVQRLFWFFTIVCATVWILVIAGLIWALIAKPVGYQNDPLQLDVKRERRTSLVVWGLVAATVVWLMVLTVASFLEDARLSANPSPVVTIELTGYQWWWQVRYLDDEPAKIFTTANEIHVPVGKPVKVRLVAGDVIHSFWVPNLAGKLDLIPGQTNELIVTANSPGIYRGQCAEFCGTQHAKMGLRVISQSPEDFAKWREKQLQPARLEGEIASTGERAFFASGCFLCHTIRGTSAGGRVGPDLTHVGSRMAIAADTLPNTVGHMAGWITDPQAIKPGNFMPRMNVEARDVNVLANYLEALK